MARTIHQLDAVEAERERCTRRVATNRSRTLAVEVDRA
jgi:hypothetical protein